MRGDGFLIGTEWRENRKKGFVECTLAKAEGGKGITGGQGGKIRTGKNPSHKRHMKGLNSVRCRHEVQEEENARPLPAPGDQEPLLRG